MVRITGKNGTFLRLEKRMEMKARDNWGVTPHIVSRLLDPLTGLETEPES